MLMKPFGLSLHGMDGVTSTSSGYKGKAPKGQLIPPATMENPGLRFLLCGAPFANTLADALTSIWRPRNRVHCYPQPLSKVPRTPVLRGNCLGRNERPSHRPGRGSAGRAEAVGTRAGLSAFWIPAGRSFGFPAGQN